ncbi:MAG: hypothetical protein HY280_04460 [Nitrospinae bacterium]|nr:hypothetical protein [Nitrospinota bacterium]
MFIVLSLFDIYLRSRKQDELSLNKMRSYAQGIANSLNSSLSTFDKLGVADVRGSALANFRINVAGIRELRVFRGKAITEQFGPGEEGEQPVDEIDAKVLATGKQIEKLFSDGGERRLRVVIPFLITNVRGGVNCAKCHQGEPGTAVGAMSLTLSLKEADLHAAKDTRNQSIVFFVELLALIAVLDQTLRVFVMRKMEAIGAGMESNSTVVNSTSVAVSESSNGLAKTAGEQDDAVKGVLKTTEEMAASTKKSAEAAALSIVSMGEASRLLQEGLDSSAEMVGAMDAIAHGSANTAKIIKTIDEIAFQTNLLALYASVEAARAGEHGKGFAVVAEEVRNLSARISSAARETTQLMTDSVRNTNNGRELVKQVADALKNVSSTTALVRVQMEKNGVLAGKTVEGLANLGELMRKIDELSGGFASSSKDLSSSSELLSAQARDLHRLVEGLEGLIKGG